MVERGLLRPRALVSYVFEATWSTGVVTSSLHSPIIAPWRTLDLFIQVCPLAFLPEQRAILELLANLTSTPLDEKPA
jgi:hypothetical protein